MYILSNFINIYVKKYYIYVSVLFLSIFKKQKINLNNNRFEILIIMSVAMI